MAQWMVVFGWCFVAAMALAILVPYLLRKADLLTSWNLFLLGSINFVGFGAIYSGRNLTRLGNYDDHDRFLFLLGAGVCYAALFAAYYFFRLPRRVASRRLNSWPPIWGGTLAVLIAIYLALLPFNVLSVNVQGVGQILAAAAVTAMTLAVAIPFMVWLDRPFNAVLLAVFAIALGAAFYLCMGNFSRRPLLSLLLGLVICLYWLKLRYRNPAATIWLIVIVGIGGMLLLAGYSAIRYGRGTAAGRLQRLFSSAENSSATGLLDGDVAVECSCIAIHRYTHDSPPQPFWTIRYVLANPIPRSFWPDKPEALGYMLPRDIGVWNRTGYVNWGPGIVGHGFHEGGMWFGLPMLAFYGMLFGGLMRLYDELMRRQPNNPFLIGTLAAASANLVAFSRGDIGYFSIYIIAALLMGLVVPQVLRFFTGTGFQYGPQALAAEPAAASQDRELEYPCKEVEVSPS